MSPRPHLETHPAALTNWRSRRQEIAATTLAAPSVLTLSQWADQFRYLSADLSEPGPWRTDRVPYLREVMDSITDPLVEEVVVMKSARIGATQALGCNAIGYYIHQEPSSIIAAFPTEGDAMKFSKQLLAPMIDATPVLRERLNGKSRDAEDTILLKSYPGGSVQMVGTTSPRSMRMVHGRIIYGSEVDAWEVTSGDDGDPIVLLKKRADSYGSPKFVWESTPLIKGISHIEKRFKESDQRYFNVPCPHCGEMQALEWGGRDTPFGVKWEQRDSSTAYYLCVACACPIEEREKYRMVAEGRWIARNPESKIRGYHLNALISPFPGARWSKLVDLWLDTLGKPEQLRAFVNTVQGLPFEEDGTSLDPASLAARLEDYARGTCPAGVAVLIASVDTQGDRLELTVWGFGEGEETWLIEHEPVYGDPGTPAPWLELDRLLLRSYKHASGEMLRPAVTMIDSGGHHAKEVYAFAKPRLGRRVFAIKGANTEGAPLLSKKSRVGDQNVNLYHVGVFTAKEALLARLGKVREPGPGFIHLPSWMDSEQLAQLTAEKLITRYQGGRPKRTWVKLRERNEVMDLFGYALAGLSVLGRPFVQSLGARAKAMMEKAEQSRAPVSETPSNLSLREHQKAASTQKRGRGGGWVNGWK